MNDYDILQEQKTIYSDSAPKLLITHFQNYYPQNKHFFTDLYNAPYIRHLLSELPSPYKNVYLNLYDDHIQKYALHMFTFLYTNKVLKNYLHSHTPIFYKKNTLHYTYQQPPRNQNLYHYALSNNHDPIYSFSAYILLQVFTIYCAYNPYLSKTNNDHRILSTYKFSKIAAPMAAFFHISNMPVPFHDPEQKSLFNQNNTWTTRHIYDMFQYLLDTDPNYFLMYNITQRKIHYLFDNNQYQTILVPTDDQPSSKQYPYKFNQLPTNLPEHFPHQLVTNYDQDLIDQMSFQQMLKNNPNPPFTLDQVR